MPARPGRGGIISRSTFELTPFTCPNCGSQEVGMRGRYEKAVWMAFSNGKMRKRKMDVGDLSIRFTHLACEPCGIEFSIEADHIFELQKANLELQLELARLSGKTVVEQPPGSKVLM